MEDIIKIKITKTARRTCDRYTSNCGCLLATALRRTKKFLSISVSYSFVHLNDAIYKFSIRNANRINAAYHKPKSAFVPFNVTLRRDDNANV